jgi:hypothetical protein
MALFIIKSAIDKGKRVAFLCNRITLVEQSSRRFKAAGVSHGVIQGGSTRDPTSQVVVASIQTVANRGLPEVDLIIIDECHTASGSRAYRELIARDIKTRVLGLSATPWSKGLGKSFKELGGALFESVVVATTVPELIAQGWLVDVEVWAPSEPDLSKVSTVAGDYNERELGDAVDKPALIGDIIKHWFKHAEGKPTVVFATNIAHSEHIRDEFIAHGITAEHVDCYTTMQEREAIFGRMRSGETLIMCNVGVLCEGVDFPAWEAMILARPTKSLIRFIQCVGRAIRVHDNISVIYNRYREIRNVCRGDALDAGRNAGEHGGRGYGFKMWDCEEDGVQALEPPERGVFHSEGAHLPAESESRKGAETSGKLFNGGNPWEKLQRAPIGGTGLDAEPTGPATGEPQGREQAEQLHGEPGVGDQQGEFHSRSLAWLIPGTTEGGCTQKKQADGVAGAGDKGRPEVLSSWSIDATGEKIRRTDNDNQRNKGWKELGACFVARNEVEAELAVRSLRELHDGCECLLVVVGDSDTGAARRIDGVIVKTKAIILDHSGSCERLGYPTDHIERELCDGTPKTSAASKEKKEKLPKKCVKCNHLKPAGVSECPACGHKPTRKSDVEVEDGTLQKLERKSGTKMTAKEYLATLPQQEIWSGLLSICKPAAASHRFKEIYGAYPEKMSSKPGPASQSLIQWERSRRIAYRSAMAGGKITSRTRS